MFSDLLYDLLYDLYFGVDQSDCPLPCTTVTSEVKFLSRLEWEHGGGVSFSFLPTVEVIKSISVFEKDPVGSKVPGRNVFVSNSLNIKINIVETLV